MSEERWSLEHEARSVSMARAAVRDFIARTDPKADSTVASLVVSELVTNAIVHPRTDGEGIGLIVEMIDNTIHIEVEDRDPSPPFVDESAGRGRIHGRGLSIVDQLSTDWGWTPVSGNGKRVWCDVPKRERDQPNEAG